jgi:hypothetical protein
VVLNRWVLGIAMLASGAALQAQTVAVPDTATQAFEESRWSDALDAYRERLEADPEDGIAWLRVAQAERELGRRDKALETLAEAEAHGAPLSMVELERARNLAALGQSDAALRQLEASEHDGLTALDLLEHAGEFADLRSSDVFKRVYGSVRRRVFPCENVAGAGDFDFWLGRWEVRIADGTLVGHSEVTKQDGGCTVVERWHGAGGASGTSISFFAPSKGEWRQVWAGSGGTLIDLSGGLVDGSMHLEGTIEYVEPERVVAFRGTWTPQPGGAVRQLLEEFDLAAQSWQPWFEGSYRPEARQ